MSVMYIRPSSDGSRACWKNTASSYLAVNENSADGYTTVIWNQGSGLVYDTKTDNYATFTNHGAETGTITKVRLVARCIHTSSDAGVGWVNLTFNTNGTTYQGVTAHTTTSWADYYTVMGLNPQTNTGWTWNEIDSFYASISLGGRDWSSKSTTMQTITYCTQLYLEVTYDSVSTIKTLIIRPDGDGTCQLTRNTATSHAAVNEVNADDATTTISNSTLNLLADIHTLSDVSGYTGTIINVSLLHKSSMTQTGAGSYSTSQHSVYIIGTAYYSSFPATNNMLTTSWAYYIHAFGENPATLSAWTWTNINDLQTKIEICGGSYEWSKGRFYYSYPYCTQIYVNVTYLLALPTVTTQAASSVEATTVTGNGNITNTGGENCTIRGVQWDVHTHSGGAYANDIHEHGDYGTGAFTISLTSLPTGTTIYARAYATNSAGTSYGDEVTFLTKLAAPTDIAATDGVYTDKVIITWTKSTGATGYRVYEGSNNIGGLLGDVATYDDTNAPEGTVSAGTVTASDGTYGIMVRLTASGFSCSNGATRTYKVVAVNATGNSADSSTNTGYRTANTINYFWAVSTDASNWTVIYGWTADTTYDYTSAPAPTINKGTQTTTLNLSNKVTLGVSGESTSNGASRYYLLGVKANGVTGQYSNVLGMLNWTDKGHDTGYTIASGTITYKIQMSAADSNASFSDLAGGTTDPFDDTSISAGTGRYYQTVLSSANASNVTTDAVRGYRTGAYSYTSLAKVGTAHSSTKRLVGKRSGVVKDGIKTLANRKVTGIRSSLVKLGIKALSNRTILTKISSLVKNGLKVFGTRKIIASKSSLAKEGIVSFGNRKTISTRLGFVKAGAKAFASFAFVHAQVIASYSAFAKLGEKAFSTRKVLALRPAIVKYGLKGATDRKVASSRIGVLKEGLKAFSDRKIARVRTSLTKDGIKLFSNRIGVFSKTAMGKVGIVSFSNRYINARRLGIAKEGLKPFSTRQLSSIRSSLLKIGTKVFANRLLASTTSSFMKLGTKAFSIRTSNGVRVPIVKTGIKTVSDRSLILKRSGLLKLGLNGIPLRKVDAVRSTMVKVGVKVFATFIYLFQPKNYAFSALLKIGTVPFAAREGMSVRVSIVKDGLKAISDRKLTSSRYSLINDGIKPLANRLSVLSRLGFLKVGIIALPDRRISGIRTSVAADGIRAFASRKLAGIRFGVAKDGIKAIASRKETSSRIGLAKNGLKALSTRKITGIRSGFAKIGDAAFASLKTTVIRSVVAKVGIRPLADRKLAGNRNSLATLGIKPLPTRVIKIIRSSFVKLGVRVFSSVKIGFIHTALSKIGIKPFSTGSTRAIRISLSKEGLTTIPSRKIQSSRSSLPKLGLKSLGNRIGTSIRSSLSKAGIKALSSRVSKNTISALNKVGIKGIGVRKIVSTRIGLAKEGERANSQRLVSSQRLSLSKIGEISFSTRVNASIRSLLSLVGIKAFASRSSLPIVAPTSHAGSWTNPTCAYDGVMDTFASTDMQNYIELLPASDVTCSSVWVYGEGYFIVGLRLKIEAYYDGSYNTIWDSTVHGTITPNQWSEIKLNQITPITKSVSKVKITNAGNMGQLVKLFEFRFINATSSTRSSRTRNGIRAYGFRRYATTKFGLANIGAKSFYDRRIYKVRPALVKEGLISPTTGSGSTRIIGAERPALLPLGVQALSSRAISSIRASLAKIGTFIRSWTTVVIVPKRGSATLTDIGVTSGLLTDNTTQ